MKIELVLINRHDASEKKLHTLDLPSVPRIGECLIFGGIENYEVKEVIYRFDSAHTKLERITVDAYSLA